MWHKHCLRLGESGGDLKRAAALPDRGESMAHKFYDRMADRAVLLAALGIIFLSLAFWSIAIGAAIHFDVVGLL